MSREGQVYSGDPPNWNAYQRAAFTVFGATLVAADKVSQSFADINKGTAGDIIYTVR